MKKLGVLLLLLATAIGALAQGESELRPPKGSKVAIVVFEDLECPDCARAAPLLDEASRTYKIPLVIHDFPLRQHPWAMDAALEARYIESKAGRKASDEFRLYIYKNQPAITPDNLRGYFERFANEHKIELPFAVDPQGKLAEGIRADQALGQRVHLDHTPTIFVVSSAANPVEVKDRSQLYQIIDNAKRQAGDTGEVKAETKKRPG